MFSALEGKTAKPLVPARARLNRDKLFRLLGLNKPIKLVERIKDRLQHKTKSAKPTTDFGVSRPFGFDKDKVKGTPFLISKPRRAFLENRALIRARLVRVAHHRMAGSHAPERKLSHYHHLRRYRSQKCFSVSACRRKQCP